MSLGCVKTFVGGCLLGSILVAAQSAAAGQLVDIYPRPAYFSDWSGNFRMSLSWADSPTASASPEASCAPPPGYLLVGGGAAIIDAQGNPGALISYDGPEQLPTWPPRLGQNDAWTSWHAHSKDHQYSYPHKVRCYAIGLQVGNLSANDLKNYVKYYNYYGGPTYGLQDWYTPRLEDGYTLLGGGGGVNYVYSWTGTPPGRLLSASEPTGDYRQWHVVTKDHVYECYGEMAISIVAINLNALQSERGIVGQVVVPLLVNFTTPMTGYLLTGRNWDTTSEYRSALTAIGGNAHYTGGGRLINNLGFSQNLPSTLSVTLYSKDHGIVSSGYNTMTWVGIRQYRNDGVPVIW